MRKWILIAALVAVAALGYLAWPFIGMAQLADAVHSRDVEDTARRIDVAAVRRSILIQLLDEGTRDTDLARKLGPLGRSAVVGLMRSALDGEIGRFLDDEGIRIVLSDGRLPTALEDELQQREPADNQKAFHFTRLPENPLRILEGWRFRSPITFEAVLGQDDRSDDRVTLRFRRTGTIWRLTNIELPRDVIARVKPLIQEKLKKAGL